MWEDALADQRCLRHEWGSGRVGESGRIVKMVCVCVCVCVCGGVEKEIMTLHLVDKLLLNADQKGF